MVEGPLSFEDYIVGSTSIKWTLHGYDLKQWELCYTKEECLNSIISQGWPK